MKEMFKKLDIDLTDRQVEQFEKYYKFLLEWNEKINLTAIVEKEEVVVKHFYDSLYLAKIVDFSNQKICDIGSGAGFPGIPLKIIYPEIDLTIVDSLGKRIKFLDLLCEELKITVTNVHARAEEYVSTVWQQYDLVFARAVAKLNILSELCIPYVKIGGKFIALKGANAAEEIANSQNAFKTLSAELEKYIEYELPNGFGKRGIAVIKKNQNTMKKYPRIYGKIKGSPL